MQESNNDNKIKKSPSWTSEPVCIKCFSTLGVESRMKLYRYLKNKGETSVGKLVTVVKLTQPTVSYHLKEMKDMGLLQSRRSGKEVFYSVNHICEIYNEECVLHKVVFPSHSSNGK